MLKFIRFKIIRNILKFFKPVRVYDNYVKSYWPALNFANKIRYIMNSWMPIGTDSPFGRLCFLRGHVIECKSPIVKFRRLSAMEIHFTRRGKDCVWTHWSEYKSASNDSVGQ